MTSTIEYQVWFLSKAGRRHRVESGTISDRKNGWDFIDHLNDLRREESNPQPGVYQLLEVVSESNPLIRKYDQ